MNKYISITLIVLISGCVDKDAATTYRCTAEQLKLVEAQFNVCNESSYLSSYCYNVAREEQCDKVKPYQSKGKLDNE